jgi:hypothetical protein
MLGVMLAESVPPVKGLPNRDAPLDKGFRGSMGDGIPPVGE